MIFAVGFAGLALGFWMGTKVRPAKPTRTDTGSPSAGISRADVDAFEARIMAQPLIVPPVDSTPTVFGHPLDGFGIKFADISSAALFVPGTGLDRTKCGSPVATNLGVALCLKPVDHPEPCQ